MEDGLTLGPSQTRSLTNQEKAITSEVACDGQFVARRVLLVCGPHLRIEKKVLFEYCVTSIF